jgi:eukaryotic-like serine/threonine-protein kinase
MERARTDLRERLQASLGDAYALEREVGGGGMSRVFVATETALGRRVVIKVLPPELAHEVSAERFRREVYLAAQLRHPLVVPVLATGDAGGLLYYTMPYVEGESLRARLARGGGLPVVESVRVLRDVVEALAYAHRRGVVHRDVKPENVLLDSDSGHALVADFGVAKALAAARTTAGAPGTVGTSAPDVTLTQLGTTLGTPAYMAPEQAVGEAVDARADLYAWGVVAYELLAGAHPFARHATPRALFAAHLSEAPEPLAGRAPAVPPPLAALVTRCLAKDPAERPASAEAVLHALDDVNATEFAAVGSSTSRRRILAQGWLQAFAVALLVLAVGWVGLAVRTRSATADHTGMASVAVLPFTNVGGDTAQLYFADGMTDELATALAKVPGVQVAARTSSYALRGNDADVRKVGSTLGVAAVLTGAVRRAGPHLRVTAQLADARTGLVRWSDAYSADSGDVFGVQAKLASAIVRALAPTFAGAPGSSDAPATAAVAAVVDTSRGTDDPLAYDLYLRARHLWYQRGAARLAQAESLFTAAAERDPHFARAYSGLALVRSTLPEYASGISYEDVLGPTRAAAERALALDSTLAEAHIALGAVLGPVGRWPEAEAHHRRALALDPRSPTAHHWYGVDLTNLRGRLPEALEQMSTAAALDPLSPVLTSHYAVVLAEIGRATEARRTLQRALALDSNNTKVRDNAGLSLLAIGDAGGALAQYQALRRFAAPGTPEYLGRVAAAFALAGRRDSAAVLAGELERGWPGDAVRNRELVYAYAALGETGKGLEALERLVAGGRGGRQLMEFIAHEQHPLWRQLRRDPRFTRLRAQVVGLSDWSSQVRS